MIKKFDPRLFLGKPRIYSAVANAPRISKLWVWDEKAGRYGPPLTGKAFMARRYHDQKRETGFFDSLDDARIWQQGLGDQALIPVQATPQPTSLVEKPGGPILRDVIEEWRRRMYPGFSVTTQVAYDKLVRLYLVDLADHPVYSITPKLIDSWLDQLKDPAGFPMQSKRRKSFRKELDTLSTVLRYYENYSDDSEFRFPLKRRHWDLADLNRPEVPKSKDLTEMEFHRFRRELEKQKNGSLMAALATVQYYQALRVSEAAGIFHEDVRLDQNNPSHSRLTIVRSVCWPRHKDIPSFVKGGFKNAGANQGVKEQPLFPQSFKALVELTQPGDSGLVFNQEGKHLEYRQIQYAYDMAFKKAGLPYRATHVMRHGGCRNLYNMTGDLSVSQQHLGNSDMQSVQVYAKRSASALTNVSDQLWEKETQETGCKWLQIGGEK